MAPEAPEDLAGFEVEEEEGVVGTAGDEGCGRGEGERGRSAFACSEDAIAAVGGEVSSSKRKREGEVAMKRRLRAFGWWVGKGDDPLCTVAVGLPQENGLV